MLRSLGQLKRRLNGRRRVLDEEVVFIMPVFRDAVTAWRALRRLRAVYPTSRIVLLSDGDDTVPHEAFETQFQLEFVLGENLYAMHHGGRMVQRMLDLYATAPARWLVRLDSDARIDRRFRWLPVDEGLYGHIGKRSGTVQGGCILLTHGAAMSLHQSRIFLDDRLLDARSSWGHYATADNLRRKLQQQRVAYDKVLHWGVVETNTPAHEFPEIFSVWKPTARGAAALENRNLQHAIVHPDKMSGEAVPTFLEESRHA